MDRSDIEAASDLLCELFRQGRRIPRLPAHLRPGTRAEGYCIQSLLQSRSPCPLFGWKIAATSAAGQRHINVDGPLAGRLMADRVIESGGVCVLAGNQMRLAEPEFAFRMGTDLLPRAQPYTVAEVLDRTLSLHPAIEIPDTRLDEFERVGAAELIADNACARHFMLGPESPPLWRTLDLAVHPVTAFRGTEPPQLGTGANVLGDPRVALAWLANELSLHATPLLRGQVVTTGTCMAPVPVREGDRFVADFGILGRVDVVFA